MLRAASVAPGSAPRKSDGWFCRNAVRLGNVQAPSPNSGRFTNVVWRSYSAPSVTRVAAAAPHEVVADDEARLALRERQHLVAADAGHAGPRSDRAALASRERTSGARCRDRSASPPPRCVSSPKRTLLAIVGLERLTELGRHVVVLRVVVAVPERDRRARVRLEHRGTIEGVAHEQVAGRRERVVDRGRRSSSRARGFRSSRRRGRCPAPPARRVCRVGSG